MSNWQQRRTANYLAQQNRMMKQQQKGPRPAPAKRTGEQNRSLLCFFATFIIVSIVVGAASHNNWLATGIGLVAAIAVTWMVSRTK